MSIPVVPRRLRAAVAIPILPLAVDLHAQVIRLGRPEAVLTDAFSFVRGVRELRSGQLLIADYIESRVVIADLASGDVRDVIREGPGPQELRLPMGLVPLRADSTLLIDYGNNRITVLAPSGRAIRSMNAELPGRSGVRGVDASGAYLHVIPSWAEQQRPLPDDSVRIVRWDPGSNATPRDVAVIQGTRFRKDRSPAMQPRLPMVGFASQDAWAVMPDGSIMVVRAQPYRVEVLAAGSAPVRGPSYPAASRAVTMADKTRFIAEFAAGSPQSGRGPNGGMGRAPLPNAAEIERMVGSAEWADTYPPFDAGAVFAAADGHLWVGMPVVPGEPVRYDIFDARGIRVKQVQLEPGRRVVHVGTKGVYAVADGTDGVQSIERYKLP